MKHRRYLMMVAGTLLLMSMKSVAVCGQETFLVITNQDNPTTTMSREMISNVYLKKVERWEDGKRVRPVDLPKSSMLRESFTRDIIGRDVSAVLSYWHQMMFSGKGVPPLLRSSESDVVEFVRSNPGAIGYISPETPVEGVKVVEIIEAPF